MREAGRELVAGRGWEMVESLFKAAQAECVVTAEIASSRFEDDLRRMRMAAWPVRR